MDAIRLSGLSFYGYHGVRPEERALGQRFTVDVSLALDLQAAGHSDDLDRTVDYALVCQSVRSVVEGVPLNLIEALAERIAARVLFDYALVQTVQVRVEKPCAPLAGGSVGSAAVELTRGRLDGGSSASS